MFVGGALPHHRRHQALHWGAALVQACSLASITWLFVGGSDASVYHRLSRVGKQAARRRRRRRHGGGDFVFAAAAAAADAQRGPRRQADDVALGKDEDQVGLIVIF